jgi:small-conductance mechanosensitive channel
METISFNNPLNFGPGFLIKAGYALFNILIILIVGLTALKFLQRLVTTLETKKVLAPPFVVFFNSVLRWFFVVILLLLVLQQIGVPLNSMWSAISAMIAMVAIGFVAVWSILSNLLSTLMLLVFQPFHIGDEIEIIDPGATSGLIGRVRNINLMFTSLEKTKDDALLIIKIPNNLFFQRMIAVKIGHRTFDLNEQLFREKSLLRQNTSKGPSQNEVK